MITQEIHEKISGYVKFLQRFVDRVWYSPLLAVLAALDNLVLVVPTDGILISSTMLIPRRWFLLGLSISVGSTIGALILAAFVEFQGLPWILDFYPGLDDTRTWALTVEFFEKYGLLMVFAVAVTPFVQQPAVILAAVADTSLVKLGLVVFAGRFIKYFIMSYLASHAPKVLGRMWGLKGELKDAGVKVD